MVLPPLKEQGMREQGEAQVRAVERIAGIVEALRVPLLVILALLVAGVIGYFVYAQTAAVSRERSTLLAEQADPVVFLGQVNQVKIQAECIRHSPGRAGIQRGDIPGQFVPTGLDSGPALLGVLPDMLLQIKQRR